MADVDKRLRAVAADGNIDAEDVMFAAEAALADGTISALEAQILRSGLAAWGKSFEPAGKAWLDALLTGRPQPLPNRVLLAPHPRGAPRDLYYARADVVALQDALSRLGYATTVDGDFGPGTTTSLRKLQAACRMPESGVLDSATLFRINEALEARGLALLDLSPRARIRPDVVVAMKGGANTNDNKAIEAALGRLSAHFGLAELATSADGRYDADTERAIRAFQRRAFLPDTGIVDTATLAALESALTAVGLAPTGITPTARAGALSRIELHFYPNEYEQKMMVRRDGAVLDIYGMVGGDAAGREDPTNAHVDYSPTPAGSYEVTELGQQMSNVWAWSYVPFGAALREVAGQIEFRDQGGVWRVATGPAGVFFGRDPAPLERKDYLDSAGALPPTWTKNDFGHLRARLRNPRTGTAQSHMIHASPFNERTDTYFIDTAALESAVEAVRVLHHSHGCEHIHPRDLDEIVAKGYLAPGTKFVVHGYDERSGVSSVA